MHELPLQLWVFVFALLQLVFVLMYWFSPHCLSVSGHVFHCPSLCHDHTVSHSSHPACRNEIAFLVIVSQSFKACVFLYLFNYLFFSQAQSNPLWCTPQQIPYGSQRHPRNPLSLLRLTVIPIMKKYVQEMGDCHRSHGNFILINFWAEIGGSGITTLITAP